MDKLVGIFCRNNSDEPWRRLKAKGSLRDLWGYQAMYPNKEVAMFEYGNGYSTNYDPYSAARMKRVS